MDEIARCVIDELPLAGDVAAGNLALYDEAGTGIDTDERPTSRHFCRLGRHWLGRGQVGNEKLNKLRGRIIISFVKADTGLPAVSKGPLGGVDSCLIGR